MTTSRSSLTSAYLLLVLTTLFWSGNFVLARATHASIPPLTLSFARWAIALLVLLPFGLKPAWQQRALWLPYWRRLLALGVFGIAGFNSLVYLGVQETTATNAVLMNSFIPILIVLLGALFFGIKASALQLLAILLSFAGVLTIVAHGELARLIRLEINHGDVVVFAAMLAWALYTLLLRGLPAGLNRLGLLTVLVVIGLSCITPFFLLEYASGQRAPLNTTTLITFAYVGTLPSVAAYYFYNLGVARVGPARAGSFIHLMPMFGALLSVLFLGEAFHAYHAAGIALILSGVWLAARANR
ncbi:DMT family transporter [Craterilacuibacter sinensis]|uniref:EamA family transporter n=1 Tax=Craterilacuibacter sinensis TaxID=2686017 RepID=A0A845BS22_9NEIS|nr:DMT family transporter [Craterilacuibacter sinensis]MXR38200.1 EamA family transporter [Craterilacuibacter sinensis]